MFSNQEAKTIVGLISTNRFESYKKIFYGGNAHITNNTNNELIFYSKIQDIYSCIYPVIQLLEITLRNKIHFAKKNHYKTEDWFPIFEAENHVSYKSKGLIKSARRKLNEDFQKKSHSPKAEDMLCRITFGFWSEITSSTYRQHIFWQANVNVVFPNRNRHSLGYINNSLKKISTLRNRLYHYEPLCKERVNAEVFLQKIHSHFYSIIELIDFCSHEQILFLKRTGQIAKFNGALLSLKKFLNYTGMYNFALT